MAVDYLLVCIGVSPIIKVKGRIDHKKFRKRLINSG
jgi:hypothetical protein